MDKIGITRAVNFAEHGPNKGASAAFLQSKLYAMFGAKIGIGWCEMIADAFGKHPFKRLCFYCGGENLVWDATAQWNVETQTMEHCDTYDHVDCSDCEGPTRDISVIIV